jgi:tetratricopeptide (TPR) repeat protein
MAIAINPDFGIAYFDKAVTLFFLNKKISAVTNFQQALELDPTNVEAYVYLADIYAEQDKRDEAREHYQKALDMDPAHERARAGMGNLG